MSLDGTAAYVTRVTKTAQYQQNGVPHASGRRERAVRAGSASGRREWAAQAGGASGRRERVARSDGVQMGRYWEVETAHEGLVPVKAGCGVSGRRERAA